MPTKKKTSSQRRGASRGDAISMLKADHEKVRGLLSALERSQSKNTARQSKLLEEIGVEVRTHAALEEEIFYPAFKNAAKSKDDKKLFFEAIEEHGVVHTELPEIERMPRGTDKFSAKAKVLKDLIEHHADEEEEEMFPRARKLMTKDDLSAVHEAMLARRQEFKNSPQKLMNRTPAHRLG
jgi:hemerythrin superfamily protein